MIYTRGKPMMAKWGADVLARAGSVQARASPMSLTNACNPSAMRVYKLYERGRLYEQ